MKLGKSVKKTGVRIGDIFYMNTVLADGRSTPGDLVKVIEITRKQIQLEVIKSNAGTPVGSIINLVR